MKCPICQAENPPNQRFCASCGSNLKTRGGADIVVSPDGTINQAGNSRWKTGGGLAAGGVLAALAKGGALSLFFKAYWIWALLHVAIIGGPATLVAVLAIAGIVLVTFIGLRRRAASASQ